MSADGPIYSKYRVYRTDETDLVPSDKHYGCEYFVLDLSHDPFAIPALLAYADACEATHPQLAGELRLKAEDYAAHPEIHRHAYSGNPGLRGESSGES